MIVCGKVFKKKGEEGRERMNLKKSSAI